MADRKWELPGIQDLTKDQDRALELPPEGQYLIIGGPGTGKSVLVTLRAQNLDSQERKHIFLVYNHMLHEASRQLAGERLNSSTYMKWFYETYRRITGMRVPLLPPEPGSGFRAIDWDAAAANASASDRGTSSNVGEAKNHLHLLIDEGQDMPPDFYQTLIDLGYEDFYVAADQNQQIKEMNSSRQELEDCLAIETADVIELKRNFRNSREIAMLARHFHTVDPASPPPALPRPGRRRHVPLLYTFNANADAYRRIANSIVTFCRDRPRLLVGIIVPNNQVRTAYLRALKAMPKGFGEMPLPISTYKSGMDCNVRFDKGGIVVLNAQSCKGLEFDAVVLADIDRHYVNRDDLDATRKLFYVMVSRARQFVFLFMNRNASSAIRGLLPDDDAVLRRKDLTNVR